MALSERDERTLAALEREFTVERKFRRPSRAVLLGIGAFLTVAVGCGLVALGDAKGQVWLAAIGALLAGASPFLAAAAAARRRP